MLSSPKEQKDTVDLLEQLRNDVNSSHLIEVQLHEESPTDDVTDFSVT